MTIKKAIQDLKQQRLSCEELIRSCLNKIEKFDQGKKGVNAVITLNQKEALNKAKEVDLKIKNREKLGKLEGIPIAVKDVITTKGLKTTAASKILENYLPPHDATCVEKLKKEGAIIIAKTNCDEFAHGASGENSAYGVTRNPYDLDRVPGGSSSGSGAIVAYGGALAALGTDTGGSIRAPGCFLGLVGLKPTYGRISRYGLISMCSSTDTVSTLTQNVDDAAYLLSVLSSKDPKDSTSSGAGGKDFARDFSQGLKGLRAAYPKDALEREGLDDQVKEIFFNSLDKLKKNGVEIEEISMPLLSEPSVATYYIIVPSEISSNLARFDGIRFGMSDAEAKNLKQAYKNTRSKYLGKEAKRRVMLGNYALSAGYYDAYYKKAQKVRRMIWKNAKEIFKKFDLILTPTMASPAFKIGEKSDPLAMYLADIFVSYASLANICALSINAGWVSNKAADSLMDENKNKLPVGIHFMSQWWDEETLLRAANGFEKLVVGK
ncbi:MAG: Asp-tRNA(Asn)/Glu-tRNA(Gln) amidotransferase subunit GatA [Candidatus Moranbacteria bacterium]|nr:Asp-tRNA(Asn)/Glu-tRNA(Gln) amidotransferase subunit GatA [Candidatus Moranbacteria bacterium]